MINKKYGKELWSIHISPEDSKILKHELLGNPVDWDIVSQIIIKYAKEGLLEKR